MTLAYNDRRGKQSGVKTPIKYYLVPKTTQTPLMLPMGSS